MGVGWGRRPDHIGLGQRPQPALYGSVKSVLCCWVLRPDSLMGGRFENPSPPKAGAKDAAIDLFR